jgi:hypothetical protein
MPYTSPYGITTTKPPPKRLPQSKASQARSAASSPRLTPSSTSTSTNASYFSSSNLFSPSQTTDELKHIPSKELGEVSSRDRDASVVESLEHWKGWNARRESEDEGDDVDPLEAGPGPAEIGKGRAQGVVVEIREIGAGS